MPKTVGRFGSVPSSPHVFGYFILNSYIALCLFERKFVPLDLAYTNIEDSIVTNPMDILIKYLLYHIAYFLITL